MPNAARPSLALRARSRSGGHSPPYALGMCTPDCYEGDNMQGGGEGPQMQMMGGGAAIIAAQLSVSVSAENMPALIAAIEQLAINPPENPATDWSAVLAALGGI